MIQDFTICVGTVGTGLWQSPDGGKSWRLVQEGLGLESRVFSLAVHPRDPRILYAGTDSGLYRSLNRGITFERLDSPMNTLHVWKVALDPTDPEIVFAGTRPSALFRSTDGGRRWERLEVEMAAECPNVRVPRVTALVVDPSDPRVVWAGVEVDGVRRSLDGGKSWTSMTDGLRDPDIHDVRVSTAAPKAVLVSTPWEIFVSTDTGESWEGWGMARHFGTPRYCRGLALKEDDPRVLFVGTGDGPLGSTGAIWRSQDRGQSWEQLPLPCEPNSPIWAFATHGADPNLVLACSHYGELFVSRNGGDSWEKLRREFAEVRALAWTPNT